MPSYLLNLFCKIGIIFFYSLFLQDVFAFSKEQSNNKNLQTCGQNYQKQWDLSKQILKNLSARTDSCWSEEQKKEIAALQHELDGALKEFLIKNKKENSHKDLQNIALKYQRIQEILSYCRMHDFLEERENAPWGNISLDFLKGGNKYLLQVLGDIFGKGSGLEGLTYGQILELQLLRQSIYFNLQGVLQERTYIASQEQAQPCFAQVQDDGIKPVLPDFSQKTMENLIKKGDTALEIGRAFRNSMESFATIYLKNIEELEKHFAPSNKPDSYFSSFYFYGGSTKHAVIYEVIKQKNGLFSFRIYNGGDGISDFHPHITSAFGTKYTPFFETKDVSKKKISSIAFLKALRDLALNDYGMQTKIESFYNNIILELDGKITTNYSDIKMFTEAQISGTCSYFASPLYNKVLLSDGNEGSYLEFIMDMKIFSIYLKKNASILGKVDPSYRLAKKSLTYLMQDISQNIKFPEDSYLDKGTALCAMEKAISYEKMLTFFENNIILSRLNSSGKENNYGYEFKEIRSPTIEKWQEDKIHSLEPSNDIFQVKDAPMAFLDKTLYLLSKKDILHSMEFIRDSIFSAFQKHGLNRGVTLGVNHLIEKTANMLLLDSDFWNEFDAEYLSQLIEIIHDYSKIYTISTVFLFSNVWHSERGLTPEEIFTQVKLFTIADILTDVFKKKGKRQGNEKEQEAFYISDLPSLYLSVFDDFLVGRGGNSEEPSFVLSFKNPETDFSFKKIKDHWKNKRVRDTFFGFERYPIFGPFEYRIIALSSEYFGKYDKGYWYAEYEDMEGKSWEDVKWLMAKTDTSLSRESRLLSVTPRLTGESTDNTNIFLRMRDISFMTYLFFYGLDHRKFRKDLDIVDEMQCKKHCSYYYKYIYRQFDGNEKTVGRVQLYNKTPFFESENLENKEYYKEIKISEYTSFFMNYQERYLSFNEGLKNLENIEDIVSSKKSFQFFSKNNSIEIPYRNILNSEEIVTQKYTKKMGVTIETFREILQANYSILETLAFFKEHPAYLTSQQYQVSFKNSLFRPGALAKELNDVPNFSNILGKFCSDIYKIFMDNGELNAAIFILNINQSILEYVGFYKKNNKYFLNTFDELNKILDLLPKELDSSVGAKKSIFNIFINFLSKKNIFDKNIEIKNIVNLLISMLYNKNYYFNDNEKYENYMENENEFLYVEKMQDIKKFILRKEKNEVDEIFGKVKNFFFNKKDKTHWNAVPDSFGLIWKDSDGYIINLDKLKIGFNNAYISMIPRNILNHELFKKYVKYDAKVSVLYLGEDIYEVTDIFGKRYKFFLDTQGVKKPILQKNIDGTWYEYRDYSFLGDAEFYYLQKIGGKKEEQEILIFSKSADKLEFIASSAYPDRQALTIYKANENGTKSNFILHFPSQVSNSSVHFLTRLEDERFIWTLVHQESGRIVSIQLPRLGLSFIADAQNKLLCSEIDSYALSPVQRLESLEAIENYIVLEKESEKIVVFSDQIQKEKDEKGSFDIKNLQANEIKSNYNSIEFFLYKLDSEGNLIPQNDAAKIYLSYIFLWRHKENDYDRILNILQTVSIASRAFTYQENEKLVDILNLPNADSDPRALALKIRAGIIFLKNKILFNNDSEIYLKDKNILSNIEKLYNGYLKIQNKISNKYITIEDELFIISVFKNYSKDFYISMGLNKRIDGINNNYSDVIFYYFMNNLSLGSDERIANNRVYNIKISNSYNAGIFKQKENSDNFEPMIYNIFNSGISSQYFNTLYNIFSAPKNTSAKKQLISILSDVTKVPEKFFEQKTYDEIVEEFSSLFEYFIINNTKISGSDMEQYFSYIHLLYLLIHTSDNAKLSLPKNAEDIRRYLKNEGDASKRMEYIANIFNLLRKSSYKLPRLLQFFREKHQDGNLDGTLIPNRQFSSQIENPSFGPVGDFTPNLVFSNFEMAAFDLRSSPIIPAATLEKFISIKELDGEEKASIQQTAQTLKSIFSTPQKSDNTFLKTHLSKVLQAVEERKNRVLQEQKSASIKDISGLVAFKEKELVPLKHILERRTKELKENIISLLKKLPSNTWDKLERQTLSQADIIALPAFEQWLALYSQKSLRTAFNVNATLTPEEVQNLLQKTTAFLTYATYGFKLGETINAIEHILSSHTLFLQGKLTHENVVTEITTFVKNATSLRHYKLAEHPEFLVFEYFMKIILRPEQLQSLNYLDLNKKFATGKVTKGNLVELIMGAGKTFVLLPLLSRMNATPEQLNIVVFPEPLLPTMTEQLTQQLFSSFGINVDYIQIERAHHYNVNKLSFLRKRLQQDLEKQNVVVMSNSSIQSLFLIFIEKSESNENNEKEIEIFRDIFRFLKKHAVVTIDEVDWILDIMTSHRFALGKPHALEADIIKAVSGLYDILFRSPEIINVINLPFLKQNHSASHSYSEENYHAYLKPLLIAEVCNPRSAARFTTENSERALFMGLDREKCENYLRTEDSSFIANLPSPSLKNIFATLYSEIEQTLSLTLGKLYKIHYGLYPKENCTSFCPAFLSIPYHAGTPVLTSRFGSDLEAANYTMQTHIEQRDSLAMLIQEYELFKKRYRNAKTSVQRNKLFDNMRKYLPSLNKETALLLTSDDLFLSSQEINKNPELFLRLVRSYALPEITVFPDQLQTNSHIYPLLFKSVQGITGTLWNYDSFPDFYDQIILSDTMARTVSVILQNSPRDVAVLEIDPLENISVSLGKLFGGTRATALIDLGGLLRGKNNESIARDMLALENIKKNNIRNVIFYNEKNELKYIDSTLKVQPYRKEKVDRAYTTAFWDLSHTTGSDLKVNASTRAVLTVNKFSTLRDVLQASYRLREIEGGQSVQFAVTKEDVPIILKTLNTHFYNYEAKTTLTLNDLLLYFVTNEALILGDLNLRSVKSSLKGTAIAQIFASALGKRVNTKTLKKTIKAASPLFNSPRSGEPAARFGHYQETLDAGAVLKKEIRDLLKPLESILGNTFFLYKKIDEIIAAGIAKIPKNITTNKQNNIEAESKLEVETEVSLELEMEVEQEQELKLDLFDIDPQFKHKALVWDKQAFFAGTLFQKGGEHMIAPFNALLALDASYTKENVGKAFFSPSLGATLNLFPLLRYTEMGLRQPLEMFGPYQKGITGGLLVLEKDKEPRFVMTTPNEAQKVRDFLLEERRNDKPLLNARFQILVYSFGNGFIGLNKALADKYPTEEALEAFYQDMENQDFIVDLITQAKFISGDVDYSTREQQFLEKFIKQDPQNILRLFQRILRYKQTSSQEFSDSPIQEIFSRAEK